MTNELTGKDFATSIADSVESFLLSVRAIAADGDGGSAVPMLLLEVSQILLAGARMGAQQDFKPREEFQPDVGMEADVDELRMGLAEMFGNIDTYSFVFDPYRPDVVDSQVSDDIAQPGDRSGVRPASLPSGRCRRGAVVVAVQLRQQLGKPGGSGAQRAADRGRSRPSRLRAVHR